MKRVEYIPNGVCSKKMIIDIENDIIKNVNIIGGCPGNSQGICALCKNMNIDDVISKLKDIKCGFKSTSCPNELAKALIEYKKEIG